MADQTFGYPLLAATKYEVLPFTSAHRAMDPLGFRDFGHYDNPFTGMGGA